MKPVAYQLPQKMTQVCIANDLLQVCTKTEECKVSPAASVFFENLPQQGKPTVDGFPIGNCNFPGCSRIIKNNPHFSKHFKPWLV